MNVTPQPNPDSSISMHIRSERRTGIHVSDLARLYATCMRRRNTMARKTITLEFEVTTYDTGAVSVDCIPLENYEPAPEGDELTVLSHLDELKSAIFDVVRKYAYVGK